MKLAAGVLGQLTQPQLFQAFIGHIEIGEMAAVAGTEAHVLQVARLLAGARKGFRSVETLAQERTIAETFTSLRGQCAQGGSRDLGRQTGRLALVGEKAEASVLHVQLQALDPLGRAPRDPEVAVLERLAGQAHTGRATGWPSSWTIWRRQSPTGVPSPKE